MITPIETTELEQQVAEDRLVIWFFCSFCMDRQDQEWVRDETIWEVYQCLDCGHENRVAVR